MSSVLRSVTSPASTSPDPRRSNLTTLVASTAAGACEATVFNPLQIAKARLQIAIKSAPPVPGRMAALHAPAAGPTLLGELRKVHAQREWFLGLKPSLVVLGVRRGVTFAAKGAIEDAVNTAQKTHAAPFYGHQLPAGAVAALSGAAAGMIEAPLTNPFRLIALLAQSGEHVGKVGSLSAGFRYVYQKDGLGGLECGLPVTLLRNWVSAGVFFGALHYLEHNLPRTDRAGLKQLRDATLSGTAMAAAVISSNGINVVQTRMQNAVGSSAGAWQTARELLRQEGWRGYFKGGAANVARTVPGAAFSYAVLNVFVEMYRKANSVPGAKS